MKILLTGATGFLGRRLFAELQKQNHQIIITMRSTTKLDSFSEEFGEVEAWGTEVGDLNNLFTKHHDIDVIVHAATDYGRNSEIPTTPFWSNEAFPVRLLELAIKNNNGLFINIDTFFNSNKSDYGYLGAYALSKRHFQEWGKLCAEANKIRFVNLRLFHLYGPGDSLDKFVPSIINRCLAGEEIDLTDGEQKRDFIQISDAVKAIKIVLDEEISKPSGYKHYDVGTGKSVRIRDFIEEVKRLCHSSAKLNFGALPKRQGEFQDACADSSGLRSIGWSPEYDIETGIKSILETLVRN